jgi:hypothetical protein
MVGGALAVIEGVLLLVLGRLAGLAKQGASLASLRLKRG